jgi:glycosyltransferase involved in cell wall biosynthesis
MHGTRIGLIGPLPPPPGGMANQTRQLARLLNAEGMHVELLETNAPYKPAWIERIWGLRALFRLIPYLRILWKTAGEVELFHVMANSGWSWHLFAAPAIWIGWMRGVPVVLNYRGGEIEEFFQKSFHWVRPSLNRVSVIIVPSGYTADVLRRRGFDVRIVKNIIDMRRFAYREGERQVRQQMTGGPHLLVTRNLEPIYDIPTALRVLQQVSRTFPQARLTVCGSGPDRSSLMRLADELGISDAVTFTGNIDNLAIAALYRSADIMLNTSLADNMPVSVLEALACGVPVVSTMLAVSRTWVSDSMRSRQRRPKRRLAVAAPGSPSG